MRSATASNLHEVLDPLTPSFLLVDPLAGEPLTIRGPLTGGNPNPHREAVWQRSVITVPLNSKTKLPSSLHPYLVVLDSPNDPILDTSLAIAAMEREASLSNGLDGDGMGAHAIGGWLQSSQNPIELARQLAEMMRIGQTPFTKATYLRLGDRRVLALLRYIAGDEVIAETFCRLHRWIYLDAQNQLAMLSARSEASKRLVLTQDQWRRMELGESVHRSLAMWLGEQIRRGVAVDLERPAQNFLGPVISALSVAESAAQRWPHRFQRPSDRHVWAALHLIYGSRLNEADVTRLMQNTAADGESPEPMRYLHHEISAVLEPGQRTQQDQNIDGGKS